MALSVDPPEVTKDWADKKGFTFTMVSDPDLKIIDTYKIRNPEVEDLALHAIYILEPSGEIFYRKIARRRAKTKELLYAIDRKPLQCCPGSCNETICDFEGADAAQ